MFNNDLGDLNNSVNSLSDELTNVNQNLPALYHKNYIRNFNIAYFAGYIALKDANTTYSVDLPTPPARYSYDTYRVTITCVASSNNLPYIPYNITIDNNKNNKCLFRIKCLSNENRYNGNLYLGVHAILIENI